MTSASLIAGAPTPAAGLVGDTRSFTLADQLLFARMSGDRNPMHLDSLAARRTQAGECVVHGVHAVLWSLERLAAHGVELAEVASLRVTFSRFIRLDQPVHLVWQRTGPAAVKAEVLLPGGLAIGLTLKFGARAPADPDWDLKDMPVGEAPMVPDSEAIKTFRGWLPTPATSVELEAAFPAVCRSLGAQRVGSIALLSTLVGMVCPGLHSVFSDFAIKLTDGPQGRPGVGVRTRQHRFRLATMDVCGSGFVGEVSAFERFPPIDAAFESMAAHVTPGEFATRRALIVGGSRGLGAATAKLIAAGGGRVTITYVHGSAEAAAVRDEIAASCGPEACRVVRFEAGVDDLASHGSAIADVTHFYYFATPRIFRQSSTDFDRTAFEEFFRIYVDGFHQTLQACLRATGDRGLHALYPSSVAVAERPKQMTEYAMVKAAGEILCQDLARARKGLTITTPRLPRVLTDQTATVPPVEAADAALTMLPLLRAQT